MREIEGREEEREEGREREGGGRERERGPEGGRERGREREGGREGKREREREREGGGGGRYLTGIAPGRARSNRARDVFGWRSRDQIASPWENIFERERICACISSPTAGSQPAVLLEPPDSNCKHKRIATKK